MFTSARLKLTAWYVLIIMLISGSFSGIIYQFLSREVVRFQRQQVFRYERQDIPGAPPLIFSLPPDPDLIAETNRRIIAALVFINLGILFSSSGLGYFLAGRTLRPIQNMVEDQNRFISDASHELKTPLTALKTSMEVFLRDPKTTLSDARTLINESITDVNKLQSLSESLLTLTHYHQSVVRKYSSISLPDTLTAAIKKMSALAAVKNITLLPTTTNVTVTGDKDMLTDLWVILLDNAIKYSPSGEVITIKLSKSANSVRVVVTDKGMGISPKDLPHVFDRFFRADTARTSESHHGFGLGLSIAQRIVSLHHGTISAASKPGKGSTFTVVLPCQGEAGRGLIS